MLLLIRDGVVWEETDGKAQLAKKDILVRDNVIEKIAADISSDWGVEVLDAAGKIAIPGFVNCHTHSTQNFLRGTADNVPLEVWMLQFLLSIPVSEPELLRMAVLLGAAEMLHSGITSVIDHVNLPDQTDPEGVVSIVEAYEEAGMRVGVAPLVRDIPYLKTLPFDVPNWIRDELGVASDNPHDIGRALDEMTCWFKHKPRRINMVLGPSAPERCSVTLLHEVQRLVEEHHLRLTMHFLESHLSDSLCQKIHGCPASALLERVGLLSPSLSLVHAVHLDDRDVERLSSHGVTVVHCPASNLKLGNGIAPVKKLQQGGVNVALGTDGVATGDFQNMFTLLKFAALLHKTERDYSKWLGASEVFDQATKNGGKLLGADNPVGVLQPGAVADIVLLDTSSLSLLPLNSFVNQLVYAADASCVDTVIIDGRIVVKRGKILTFDEQRLVEELRLVEESLIRRNRVLPDAALVSYYLGLDS